MSRLMYRPLNLRLHQCSKFTALSNGLLETLAENENLVLLASGLATHTRPSLENPLALVVRDLARNFSNRFFGVGDMWENLVPTTTELWTQSGLRPVVLMSSTDLARNYASITSACVARLPIIFVLAAGLGKGQTDLAHNHNDLAILRTIPNLQIATPTDEAELKQQLTIAARENDQPVVLRFLPLRTAQPTPFNKVNLGAAFGIGKAQMLKEGKNLAILAAGSAVAVAVELAEALAEKGFEPAVVNARWVRPLDEPLLGAIINYFPRIITLEDGDINGGFGAEVLELLERRGWYNVKVKRIGLEEHKTWTIEGLTEQIKHFMERLNRQENYLLPKTIKKSVNLKFGLPKL